MKKIRTDILFISSTTRAGLLLFFLLIGCCTSVNAQEELAWAPQGQEERDTSTRVYEVALEQWQSGQFLEAEQRLLPLAEAGYLPAQSFLAAAYLKGEALAQDYEQALHWCNRCALEGEDDCIYMLGSMYYYGMGLPKDWAQALGYYEFLAEQGHLQAQVNAGRILMMRAQPDYEAALAWLLPAAENENHPDAQALLGYAYNFGFGVKRNEKKATRFYRKAARGGHTGAQQILEKDGVSW